MAGIRGPLYSPTDFSIRADSAWSYTLAFARQVSAELHLLLRVVTPPPRLKEAASIPGGG